VTPAKLQSVLRRFQARLRPDVDAEFVLPGETDSVNGDAGRGSGRTYRRSL
jgi:hypothetical protein